MEDGFTNDINVFQRPPMFGKVSYALPALPKLKRFATKNYADCFESQKRNSKNQAKEEKL